MEKLFLLKNQTEFCQHVTHLPWSCYMQVRYIKWVDFAASMVNTTHAISQLQSSNWLQINSWYICMYVTCNLLFRLWPYFRVCWKWERVTALTPTRKPTYSTSWTDSTWVELVYECLSTNTVSRVFFHIFFFWFWTKNFLKKGNQISLTSEILWNLHSFWRSRKEG